MPSRYATLNVRTKLRERIANMEECKHLPQAWEKIQDKPAFEHDLAKSKKQLDEITPPDVSPEARDKLRQRARMLTEAIVKGKPGIVPRCRTTYENEKVPAGTVGELIAHDQFWKKHTLDEAGNIIAVDNKRGGRGGIFELKDLERIIHKDEEYDNPEVASFERKRPPGNTTALAETHLPVSYAQGAGVTDEEWLSTVGPRPEFTPPAACQKATEEKARYIKTKRGVRKVDPNLPRCMAVKADGSPCKGVALSGRSYCLIRSHREQMERGNAPTETPAVETALNP